MALMTPEVNGARQELPCLDSPEVNGARQEVASVKKYIDGAWREVWSAVKEMIFKSNTITKNTWGRATEDNLGYSLFKFMDASVDDGSVSGSGTITFYLEGDWTNPTISLIGEGGLIRSNSDYSTWYRAPAGDIQIYSRTTSGVEKTTTVIDNIGSAMSTTDGYIDTEVIEYSGTLNGTFDRLGISLYITGYSSNYYSCSMDLIVKDVLFDGKKIAFPDYTFDNM